MEEEKMSDEDLKLVERVLHPVPENQDGDCEHIVWMGHDLIRVPGGEYKCMLQPEVYGDILAGGGFENTDYLPCNCSDHNKCEFYNGRVNK